MTWTETKVARILARNTFADATCCLPNCTWTGYETDLLVVAKDRRVIDVEIKLSKDDLKADGKKDKWWEYPARGWLRAERSVCVGAPRSHPPKVWKHYYAVPKDVWQDDWLPLVQPSSGVLLVRNARGLRRQAVLTRYGVVDCIKRSKPARNADRLDDAAMNALARLCTLRMWDTYYQLELAQANLVKVRGYQAVDLTAPIAGHD